MYVIKHCSEKQKKEIIKYGSCLAMDEHFDEKMKSKSVRQILQWYEEAVQMYQVREYNFNEPDYRRDNNDDAFRDMDDDNWNFDHWREDGGYDVNPPVVHANAPWPKNYARRTGNPYVIDILPKSPR